MQLPQPLARVLLLPFACDRMRQVIFSKCLLTNQNKRSIFGVVLQKADTKTKLINTVAKACTGCYSKNIFIK
jgi:hypothetical protein